MSAVRAELSRDNPLYIDKHSFYAAYHFALRYSDWKAEYQREVGSAIRGVGYSDAPRGGSGPGDPTARIAMRAAALRGNIELVESCALAAGGDLAEYLLRGVTTEGETYVHLRTVHGIPCGRNQYYTMRRLFYYLLSHRMEELGSRA